MNWTESQRRAIDSRGRRVLVSAGAGSGKTRVLVERFIELLAEHPDWNIDSIAAVTFTEKAAREMTSRIRAQIRVRIEESESPESRHRWRFHRAGLESARIGTIHALCASILREHAVEAGLDPAFEVIDEIEAAVLVDRAIEETLHEIATSPVASVRQITGIEVFSFLSPYQLRGALRALFNQGDRARVAAARLNGLTAPEILTRWRVCLEQVRSGAVDRVLGRESWSAGVRVLRASMAQSPFDKREQARTRVVELLDDLDRVTSTRRSDDDAGLLLQTAQATDRKPTPADLLVALASQASAKGGSVANWGSRREFEAVGQSLQTLRAAIKEEKVLNLELNESDRLASELTAGLVAVVDKARQRFDEMKRDRTCLDFDDLEIFADRLLSSRPDVRERYTSKQDGVIRALMVDEFQDISPVQKRLLWMLTPESQELFLIGDAKQSIYRFRGADVAVFNEVQSEFREAAATTAPVETMNASSADRRKSPTSAQPLLPFFEEPAAGPAPALIALTDCFRSNPGLVSFFNHVFRHLLDQSSGVAYQSMTAARTAPAGEITTELRIIRNRETENRMNVDELREAEARMMAARISELVSGRHLQIYDGTIGTHRNVEFGDIGILFQVSTSFELYEQALADQEIPYLTIAGRGFYDRQEITDLSNLLLFLQSPIDSLSLAAVLRSPMFAVSDETLLRLRLTRKPLWDAMRSGAPDPRSDESQAIEFAKRTLTRLSGLAGRASVGEIISAAISETGYLATLMALPHGDRRVANVGKFLEQADAARSLTMPEFIDRLTELRIREAREGEATVEEAGAVRIMTVHRAKGLEFPVVWIADAAHPGFRDTSIVATHPEFGLAADIKSEPEGGGESARPASFEAIRLLDARLDDAEKKRLLYVAATRARDFLLVSGGVRGKPAGDHWLGQILGALGLSESDRPSVVDYPGGRVALEWFTA